MKHRMHLICLIPAALLAIWLVTKGGSTGPLAGVGFALLLCPLTMGAVMWLLMRQTATQPTHDTEQEHEHVGGAQ